jgi:hypothetical protein
MLNVCVLISTDCIVLYVYHCLQTLQFDVVVDYNDKKYAAPGLALIKACKLNTQVCNIANKHIITFIQKLYFSNAIMIMKACKLNKQVKSTWQITYDTTLYIQRSFHTSFIVMYTAKHTGRYYKSFL